MRSRELDAPADVAGRSDEELLERARAARRRTASTWCSRRSGAGVERRGRSTRATAIDRWFLRELRGARARRATAPFAGERAFRAVDTCAAEFEAATPYYYSGWERAGGEVEVVLPRSAARRRS